MAARPIRKGDSRDQQSRVFAVVAGITGLSLTAATSSSAGSHPATSGLQAVCAQSLARPHVTLIAEHRTAISDLRSYRVTEPVCRPTGLTATASSTASNGQSLAPAAVEGCTLNMDTAITNRDVLVGTVWTSLCVNIDVCDQAPALEQKETTPDQENWILLKDGPSTSGCGVAHIASVSASCFAEPTIGFSYRTRGIFTLIADNGTVLQFTEFNTGIGPNKLACG